MQLKVLVVVDMQNDFICGALGSDEAKAAVPAVAEKIKAARAADNTIILFTQDTHFDDYIETQEGRKLPVPHCKLNDWGWKLHDMIQEVADSDNDEFVVKHTFGSFEVVNRLALMEDSTETDVITDIELCGLCTDICVIANAILLKTAFPEARIHVDAYACAGATPQGHENALKAMQTLQIDIENWGGADSDSH